MASIRKRGSNSYLIVVSRGYDYEGNRLKSVQKTVKPPKEYTQKQAEKWVKEQAILFEREVQHTPESINRSITLAKYIEHWVDDIGPKKLADSTFCRDLQDIRRILPALGNYKLTALRKEVIRNFYEQMRHSPRMDGRGDLSENSVEGLHNTLCSVLSSAVDEGYLTHNPAWRCYKPKGKRKERPVADEETVKKLITAFEGQSMKYETYFKLVLATGLRRGEACGLRWSDINWRKRTIHVQRGVVKLSHQESITKDPKTASGDRLVYLSKEMCQLLKAWRKECEWDRAQTANETVSEGDYLFRQPNGKPMCPSTFTYRFKLILKANNLPLDLSLQNGFALGEVKDCMDELSRIDGEEPIGISNLTQELGVIHEREENRDTERNFIPLFYYDKANKKVLVLEPTIYEVKSYDKTKISEIIKELKGT